MGRRHGISSCSSSSSSSSSSGSRFFAPFPRGRLLLVLSHALYYWCCCRAGLIVVGEEEVDAWFRVKLPASLWLPVVLLCLCGERRSESPVRECALDNHYTQQQRQCLRKAPRSIKQGRNKRKQRA